MSVKRKMPRQLDLGQHVASVVGQPLHQWESKGFSSDPQTVMGYKLPSWQRPFVWTEAQCIKLIESLWLGINIGTYTFNRSYVDDDYDDLLIDGQQRLRAIQTYLEDGFPVFGYRWLEITDVDRRMFYMRHFHCFITETTDDAYLRDYYNKTNFGGTPHKESERA